MIDTLAIIHRYYPEGSDIERVLRQHAEDVTGLALELVDAHPEMGLDREFVAEAAMLHDIGIYQTSAPEIFCTGEAPYILHGCARLVCRATHASPSATRVADLLPRRSPHAPSPYPQASTRRSAPRRS